jgi:hypothetical protein
MKRLERQFVRELGDVFARKYEMSFDDLVKAFKAVETHYLELETKPFLILETKRRVAEKILMAALDKRCPYEICRAQLDNLFELGFTNLEMKATMCLFFARHCRATRHAREGIELLEPVVEELQSELNRAGIRRSEREFWAQLLNHIEVALSKLRESISPTT